MATLEPDRTVLLRVAERLCDVAAELRHRALTVHAAAATMRWDSSGAAAFRDNLDDTVAALRTAAGQFVAEADRLRCIYTALASTPAPWPPAAPLAFPVSGAFPASGAFPVRGASR